MLPEAGSPERAQLEEEALRIGLVALSSEHGNIPNALYEVYEHFPERFIEERGLMDVAPGVGEEWREALTNAHQLEAFVNDTWVITIWSASEA